MSTKTSDDDVQLCEDCGAEVASSKVAKCDTCGMDGLCPECVAYRHGDGTCNDD